MNLLPTSTVPVSIIRGNVTVIAIQAKQAITVARKVLMMMNLNAVVLTHTVFILTATEVPELAVAKRRTIQPNTNAVLVDPSVLSAHAKIYRCRHKDIKK